MSEHTHIIIPIKDIEYWLRMIESQEYEINNSIWVKDYIEKSLKQNKQISLDEKDIEEKAEKEVPYSYSRSAVNKIREGYKQALKDLIKNI